MRSPIKEEEYGRSVLVIIDNIIEVLVIVNQNGKDEFQKRLSKSSETTINFILFRLSILQDAYIKPPFDISDKTEGYIFQSCVVGA